MMDELRELYQEVILDHGRRPRNFGRPERATCEAMGNNPLCGDRLMVFLDIDADRVIRELGFVGNGCAISVASASLMTEIVKGKTVGEAEALFETVHRMCTGDDAATPPADMEEETERLLVLSGVREFPVRVKCATLAWHTLKAAMNGVAETSTED
ncbi:MAG: Fe-S cluster assembly sulfur transfer protein SufU [Kiloniellales bacterium]